MAFKKTLFITYVFLILMGEILFTQQKNNEDIVSKNINELYLEINNLISSSQGKFALAFSEIGNEDNKIFINEDEVFHAASTFKTAVMIEVFRQAKEGRFSLDDSIYVKNEFRSIVDGSSYSLDISEDEGKELYSFIGKYKSIRELVFDMITVSSNLATNLLIDLVGAENVTKTIGNIGAKNLKVLRGVEDIKAFKLGLNNSTTAKDLLIVYESLATNKILDRNACEEMIEILSKQKFNDLIPKYLPKNLKIAHKTGSISKTEHDSGIVFLDNGKKYILVILSTNLENLEEGKELIARISKLIFDYMMD